MNLLNDVDLDLDPSDESITSKKQRTMSRLKENNLLKYGAIITETDVEHSMGIVKNDIDKDLWQLVKLQFREMVKSEGFYITSRGRKDDLYILLAHEMPLYNEKKNKAVFRNLKLRTRALHMVDQSLLSSEHQKKLEFEIFRNANFEIKMSESLKERCRY
jgi:hypothetical protein